MQSKAIIPKTCKCCEKVHTDLTDLTFIGIQSGGDLMPDLNLYNCSCNSTIAIKFEENKGVADIQAAMKKNRENKDRLAKERLQTNMNVLKSYRLK